MEDTQSRAQNSCPTCGAALQVAELDWLDEGAEGEETVFELEPTPAERAAIVSSLVAEGIRHRWETVDELVVADARADAVDTILDDVLGAETRVEIDGVEPSSEGGDDEGEPFDDEDFDADDEHDEDGGDYEVLSQLYLATGRLQKRRDPDEVSEFLVAAGAALVTAQPFGVDEETWADIQSAARNLAAQLESEVPDDEPEPESIVGDLQALRNQLHQLV